MTHLDEFQARIADGLTAPSEALDSLILAMQEGEDTHAGWVALYEVATAQDALVRLAEALAAKMRSREVKAMDPALQVDLSLQGSWLHGELLGDLAGALKYVRRGLKAFPGEPNVLARAGELHAAEGTLPAYVELLLGELTVADPAVAPAVAALAQQAAQHDSVDDALRARVEAAIAPFVAPAEDLTLEEDLLQVATPMPAEAGSEPTLEELSHEELLTLEAEAPPAAEQSSVAREAADSYASLDELSEDMLETVPLGDFLAPAAATAEPEGSGDADVEPLAGDELQDATQPTGDALGDSLRAATTELDLGPLDQSGLQPSEPWSTGSSGAFEAVAVPLAEASQELEAPVVEAMPEAELAEDALEPVAAPPEAAPLAEAAPLQPAAVEAAPMRASEVPPAPSSVRRSSQLPPGPSPAEQAEQLEARIAEQAARGQVSSEDRLALATLYVQQLAEPDKAMESLQALLAAEPEMPRAVALLEAMVPMRRVSARAAALLADAYQASGRSDAAAAMLARVLASARSGQRNVVRRRLAFLRQDALGDPEGALELLLPVVGGEPEDKAARQRLVSLGAKLGRLPEVTEALDKALQVATRPETRTSLAAELGRIKFELGDVEGGRLAMEFAFESGRDDSVLLAAATALSDAYAEEGKLDAAARALEAVVRLEPDLELRSKAARRLIRLCKDDAPGKARSEFAWRALVESTWAEEALQELERRFREEERERELCEILTQRARRASGAAAAELWLQAALLTARLPVSGEVLPVAEGLIGSLPDSAELAPTLVALLSRVGFWQDLETQLDRGIAAARGKTLAGLLGARARVALGRGARGQAAVDLARAVGLDPGALGERSLLASLLDQEPGLWQSASLEQAYTEAGGAGALQSLLGEVEAKTDQEPLAYRLLALRMAGDRQQERALLRELSQSPSGAEARVQLAELELAEGNVHAALEALSLDAPPPEGAGLLCEALLALAPQASRQPKDLLAALQRALELTPGTALSRRLGQLRATLLAGDESTREQATAAYSALVTEHGDRPLVDAMADYLATLPAAAAAEGWRWLMAWRVERGLAPVVVLTEWAHIEREVLQDPTRALACLERLVQMTPSRLGVWRQLAELRQAAGDARGALEALEQVAKFAKGEQLRSVELAMAELLLDHLGRPVDALELIATSLEAERVEPEVISLVQRALAMPAVRDKATRLLDRVAEVAADPSERAEVLEQLLETVARATPEERARWYRGLIECRSDSPEVALEVALRAASELPADTELWDAAEGLVRTLKRPALLAEAYRKALDATKDAGLAEELGRRLVDFHEEWFEDTEGVLQLLSRIVRVAPQATWAFDRLKLAYNSAGRWDDLFSLYDSAIAGATEDSTKIELLREVSMAAKDFAAQPERAIAYLVRLRQLAPADQRVELALERLYERQGHARPLIALLSDRLPRVSPLQAFEIEARMAGLWLDCEETLAALQLVEGMLQRHGAQPKVVQLLERLVELASSADSFVPPPPSADKGKGRKATSSESPKVTVRERASVLLEGLYEKDGRVADVARMQEVQVSTASSDTLRIERLSRVVQTRWERLAEPSAAVIWQLQLVRLSPQDEAQRQRLDALAELVGERARQAALLEELGMGTEEDELRAALLLEAATVQEEHLRDEAQAMRLYLEVLALQKTDAARALTAARRLEVLMARAGHAAERCSVLEQQAALETSTEARREALGEAARVALEQLGDTARAEANWRARLAMNPEDLEALGGLVAALDAGARWRDLVVALRQRKLLVSTAEARVDGVRVARLLENELASPQEAIDAWLQVRQSHGPDEESFAALRRLFEHTGRHADLARLLTETAELAQDDARRVELHLALGEVHRQHTGDILSGLEAFVAAAAWQRCIEVAGATHVGRELGRKAVATLYRHATAAWAKDAANTGAERASLWALEELTERLLEAGEHGEVVQLLLSAVELPLSPRRKRELQRDAAAMCADRLEQPERAIELLTRLLAEDPTDTVAQTAVNRLSALLEHAGRFAEVAALWESQAEWRLSKGDRGAAAALLTRAAEIWEEKALDIPRAMAVFTRAGELGGEPALDALARLHTARGEHGAAASVLERLVKQSGRSELAGRALRLADALVAAGDPGRAQGVLEDAVVRALDPRALRARLADLYREAKAWERLAELLVAEAASSADVHSRSALLQQAAAVHLEQRKDPAAAVPVLRQALELNDDRELRLKLAEALRDSEQYEDAADVLRDQIDRYGTRRPKERAAVHHALAKVLLASGDRSAALAELDLATRIDPADARVLYDVAHLAAEDNKLDQAEQKFRALLLVLGSGASQHGGPSRSEALLELSDIAQRRGDSMQAEEFIESAFEAGMETPYEAHSLERALRGRQRNELLVRAVEARLQASAGTAAAASALADLTTVYGEMGVERGRVEAYLQSQAEAVFNQLKASAAEDETAWSALARVYEWLGDPSAEQRVLELQVQALMDAAVTGANHAGPFYRLAQIRISQPERRGEALVLYQYAMKLRPEYSKTARALLQALDDGWDEPQAVALAEQAARGAGEPRLLVEALLYSLRTSKECGPLAREAAAIARGLGDLELTETLLTHALLNENAVLSPEDAAWIRMELASILEQTGAPERAWAMRRDAAAFMPEEEGRRVLLGVAEALRALPEEVAGAVEIYESLRQRSPSDRVVWEPLLDLYRVMDKQDQLLKLISETAPLVESLEDRGRLRVEQAGLLEKRGDVDGAVTILREVLAEVPSQPEAAERLATLLEKLSRFEELMELLTSLLDAAKDRAEVPAITGLCLRLANLLEGLGRPEDALDRYRVLLDWEPTHLQALRAVLRLAEARGDQLEIAAALEALLTVETGAQARPLVDKLVQIRVAEGDQAGEERALRLGVVADPTWNEERDRLLGLYAERGDYTAQASLLEESIARHPQDAELRLRLVDARLASGAPEQAVQTLDALIADGLRSPAIYARRAAVYRDLGQREQALADLEAAVHEDPSHTGQLIELLEEMVAVEPSALLRKPAVLRLTTLLEGTGQGVAARDRLVVLASELSSDVEVQQRLATLAEAQGDVNAACLAYAALAQVVEPEQLVPVALRLSELASTEEQLHAARSALEAGLRVAAGHLAAGHAELIQRLKAVYQQLGELVPLAELMLEQANVLSDAGERLAALLQAGALLLEARTAPERAAEVLSQAQQLAPEDPGVVVLVARAEEQAGRADAALERLQALIAASKGRRVKTLAPVYRELARIQLADGFISDAVESLSKAFDMDLRNGAIAMELGRLALEAEEEEVALRAFRAVSMMKTVDDPSEGATAELKADAYFFMARMAHLQGDPRKAKMLAQKALAEQSDHQEARDLIAQL